MQYWQYQAVTPYRSIAIVDFSKPSADAVSIVDTEATTPVAFLDSNLAVVVQSVPPSVHWFTRSLPSHQLLPLPSSKLTASDQNTFPGFLSYELSSNSDALAIIGVTNKLNGTFQYWLDPFLIQGSAAQTITCSPCADFDPGKFDELAQPRGATPVPQPVYNPTVAFAAVRSSIDLHDLMFMAGDFLEVVDLPSTKVLLSTSAALPRLVEQNVAIVQDSRHLLKVYALHR